MHRKQPRTITAQGTNSTGSIKSGNDRKKTMDSRLETYEDYTFSDQEHEFTVYKKAPPATEGLSPAIVVMHEVPGIYPAVIDFSERLIAEGYTVYMPSLLGTPGKAFSNAYTLASLAKACISREFHVLAKNKSSPITDALRALCRQAHEQCGGVGVGAIGMCLTGNFALSLMADKSVMAPVLSQPSLPFPMTKAHKSAMHISDNELRCIKTRIKDEGAKVLGLRFTNDPMCPPERFRRLEAELGNGFESIEIDSSSGNPYGLASASHSVVTRDLVDTDGHPTQEALHAVLGFFAMKLKEA
ncbi:MAG: dienelactone hydrolase [Bacteroidia bacterium]|jgi:dienelactone hydrolase